MKAAKALILLLCLVCLTAPAAAAGGAGTAANPYIIQTAAELQSIQNNLAAYYILGNDIDMSGVTTWSPIGPSNAPFIGSLNGNGYSIFSLSGTNRALFNYLGPGATIQNIVLENCISSSTNANSGLLVNVVKSSTTTNPVIIRNVDAIYCSLNSNTYFEGLLIGYVDGYLYLYDCDVKNSKRIGNSCVGSLVGVITNGGMVYVDNSMIENCYITTTELAGSIVGVIGKNSGLSVTNSICKNNIIRSSKYSGGITGGVDETGSSLSVDNSDVVYCTIVSSVNHGAGGIAGRYYASASLDISNCNIIGCSILGSSVAGGIIPPEV